MKKNMIALLGLLALTGCAGSRQSLQSELTPDQRLVEWCEKDKAALVAHSSAKTPAELTLAIDNLVAVAEAAPIPEAREMAVRDACLAAAAAADGAVLIRLNCEAGALNKLLGGY